MLGHLQKDKCIGTRGKMGKNNVVNNKLCVRLNFSLGTGRGVILAPVTSGSLSLIYLHWVLFAKVDAEKI